MKRLHFTQVHNLNQLHDELLVALPVLADVYTSTEVLHDGIYVPELDDDGNRKIDSNGKPLTRFESSGVRVVVTRTDSNLYVEGRGDDIWLTVPDAVQPRDIAAVVKAHVPAPVDTTVLEPPVGLLQCIAELIDRVRVLEEKTRP